MCNLRILGVIVILNFHDPFDRIKIQTERLQGIINKARKRELENTTKGCEKCLGTQSNSLKAE